MPEADRKRLDYVILPRRLPGLALLERYLPPPADNLLDAELAAFATTGDTVLDPWAGTGWTARRAVVRGMRAVAADPGPFAQLAALAFLWWQIQSRGGFVSRELADRALAVDPSLLFGPALALLAAAIATTEKDMVRLLRYRPFPMPVTAVPLTIDVDPRDDFRQWLAGSIAAARDVILG